MADPQDPFSLNVIGVQDLIANKTNKTDSLVSESPEGAAGEKYGVLTLDMDDASLLKLRTEWEKKYGPYENIIKQIAERNKESYLGKKANGQWLAGEDNIAANIQFEAEETFLAATLSKNPDPFVFADNTPEGNAISTAIKTMLQFHSQQLGLRNKLSVMTRQWSIYHLGVLKYGFDEEINDISVENRKIQDFIFDPEGFVDGYGAFVGYLGERMTVTAERLIELFPESKSYISETVAGELGTKVTYTEWWTDTYTFTTYKEKVLDKHKNQYFRYPEEQKDADGNPILDDFGIPLKPLAQRNHFARPRKPYTFLSVYSLQEQPHDITGLIEQNIPNQRLITRRTEQVDFNVSAANNSFAFSQDNFNEETAKQAADARRKGNPILIPQGAPIAGSVMPLNAQSLPADVFTSLEISKNDLRTSWGVQGITAEPQDEDQTARGMILNQSHDTSRIGGGIGAKIEICANDVFNWLTQLYYVFYDDNHFGAVLGTAKAVEYAELSNANFDRQLIVGVAPDSMKPKDEVTDMNLAQALYDKGAIGPKTLLKMVNFPNPDEAASDGALWNVDKLAYIRINFPEMFAELQGAQAEQAQQQMAQEAQGAAMNVAAEAGIPPEAITEPEQQVIDPASAALSEVPLPA